MVTSLTNRKILAEPTAVNRLSELAGYGPPCCMAFETTTPVGTSFIIILPTLSMAKSMICWLALMPSELEKTLQVNCPAHSLKYYSMIRVSSYMTTVAYGPNISDSISGLLLNSL